MNTKKAIITFALIASCATMPLFASAAVSAQPLDLLGVISTAFQNELASIYSVISHAIVAPVSVSTSTKPTAPIATSTTANGNGTSAVIVLKMGDKSVLVAMLQRGLISGGYLKSLATGLFDANTQAAVEAFQKAKGLPVTGYITMTQSAVASSFKTVAPPFVPIKVGATGAQANVVQGVLIKTGNLKLATTTGYIGTVTEVALEAFQKAHNLPQTGVIDRATFSAMNGK